MAANAETVTTVAPIRIGTRRRFTLPTIVRAVGAGLGRWAARGQLGADDATHVGRHTGTRS